MLLPPLLCVCHQPLGQQPPHYLINAGIGGCTDQEVGFGGLHKGRAGADCGSDGTLVVGLRRGEEGGREGRREEGERREGGGKKREEGERGRKGGREGGGRKRGGRAGGKE